MSRGLLQWWENGAQVRDELPSADHTYRGALAWASNPQPWSFELINDHGWRVCAVTAPDPCHPSSGINCQPSTAYGLSPAGTCTHSRSSGADCRSQGG